MYILRERVLRADFRPCFAQAVRLYI